MHELEKTLEIIKPDVDKRIKNFKILWQEADEKRLFQELAFCLLTPQSKAQNAWKTILILSENNLLFTGQANEISEYLNYVRFKNNKARYIVKAREQFFNSNEGIRETLLKLSSVKEKREWLLKNITGYGMKESSHFLRNIGFVEGVSILDRHILKNLKKFNVIDEIPQNLSKKKYYKIENKMKRFSKEIDISLGYLDFIFWYKATNTLFK
ncbi:MAG: N-glycosylase/DNA lyase [Bacteroidales bacterium]|nr:N-glycosylase/DNA lyase [Bacteroidales bacterium]